MALEAGEIIGGSVGHAFSGAGNKRGVAPGNSGASAAGSNQSRGGPARPGPDVTTVWIITAGIALTVLIWRKALSEGVFLALLVFLVFGAIVPPVAIAVGLVILLVLWLRGAGTAFFNWLGGLVKVQPKPIDNAYAPLGGTVPGYQPPTSSNPYAPIAKSVP